MNPMWGRDLGGICQIIISDQMAAGDRAIKRYSGPVVPIYLFIRHRHCRGLAELFA